MQCNSNAGAMHKKPNRILSMSWQVQNSLHYSHAIASQVTMTFQKFILCTNVIRNLGLKKVVQLIKMDILILNEKDVGTLQRKVDMSLKT